MMEKYNTQKPIVYNTYQLYLHDKLASLKADFAYAQTRGFYLGAKLVWAAYMEIERDRAKKEGYRDTIQHHNKASDIDSDQAGLICFKNNDLAIPYNPIKKLRI